jgi:type II secretory pathway component GspD/PulD (secretin)
MRRRITDNHWNKHWNAAIALCFVTGTAFAQITVQVIPLKYRQADEVIPTLEPLLGRDSSISSFQNQLVVRGTPLEIAHVKRAKTPISSAIVVRRRSPAALAATTHD